MWQFVVLVVSVVSFVATVTPAMPQTLGQARLAALMLIGLSGRSVEVAAAHDGAPTVAGAYARLPEADQRVVRSLFRAQRTGSPRASLLTLDEIAARRKPGPHGWDDVFHTMRSDGLLDAPNLDAVLAQASTR